MCSQESQYFPRIDEHYRSPRWSPTEIPSSSSSRIGQLITENLKVYLISRHQFVSSDVKKRYPSGRSIARVTFVSFEGIFALVSHRLLFSLCRQNAPITDGSKYISLYYVEFVTLTISGIHDIQYEYFWSWLMSKHVFVFIACA